MPPKKSKPVPVEIRQPIFAVIADLHIGNHNAHATPAKGGINSRCQEGLDALRDALLFAVLRDCQTLFIAGDLFDRRRPEPAVIAGVQKVLEQGTRGTGLDVVIVPGNHDMLDATAADGNTALAPLYREARIIHERVVWLLVGKVNVFCVPFQSLEPMRTHLGNWLTNAAGEASPKNCVLITHVGVYDDPGPAAWKDKANDAIHADALLELMQDRFAAAFVGNFHHGQQWARNGATVCQVGTLCPHSFSDEGAFPQVGGMALYDGETIEMVEIPGPRFMQPKTAEEAEVAAKGAKYIRTAPELLPALGKGKAGAFIELSSPIDAPINAGPLPQVGDAKQAIAEFVDGMDLPDDIDRNAVHAEALAIWNSLAGAS